MPEYAIRLPRVEDDVPQDQEWCQVLINGAWKRFRFHDYGALYEVPGLYEQLFYEHLQCSSHRRVSWTLMDVLKERSEFGGELRVLELGAGNGVVGEELLKYPPLRLFGLDITPQAEAAARRDRPGVYDGYLTADVTRLSDRQKRMIDEFRPNCLVTVAALGFGDIPPEAFTAAYNFVARDGWVAFNVKEHFLKDGDRSGFETLIRRMVTSGALEIEAYRVYCHRLSIRGDRLYYVAIVGRKRSNWSPQLAAAADRKASDPALPVPLS